MIYYSETGKTTSFKLSKISNNYFTKCASFTLTSHLHYLMSLTQKSQDY